MRDKNYPIQKGSVINIFTHGDKFERSGVVESVAYMSERDDYFVKLDNNRGSVVISIYDPERFKRDPSPERTHISCPSHCCQQHGCKYGYDDCPVVLGESKGVTCEDCYRDEQEKGYSYQERMMEIHAFLKSNLRIKGTVLFLKNPLTGEEEVLVK